MAQVQIKRLNDRAILPAHGSPDAAGYDLYACLDADVTVPPHATVKIGTGLSLALPEGTFGAVFARSGLAAKEGLRPANCVGVCDSDYRGEYIIALHNDSDSPRVVRHGDRIAQLVLLPYLPMDFEEVVALSATITNGGENVLSDVFSLVISCFTFYLANNIKKLAK